MRFMPSGRRQWMFVGLRILVVFGVLAGAALGLGLYVTRGPGVSYRGELPPLTSAQRAAAARLKADVTTLATEIGARDMAAHPKALAKAAAHVEARLRAAGYAVARRPFEVKGRPVDNLEAVLAGGAKASEVVVVGAHYDSVPTTPGADDNASGTAALIEVARAMRGKKPARTVRFVAFVNEEPPYFKTEAMGSLVYARALARSRVNVVGMLSLETLGYYDPRPDSQRYPAGLSLFYPSTGDFVAFVGTGESRTLVHRLVGAFRAAAKFPSESIAAPSFVQGVDYSDHWSFVQVGFRAVMVTDTAFMRNQRYHEAQDTADTLDYERMARMVEGLTAAVAELAEAR